MNVTVWPALLRDALALAPRLRAAEVDEVFAADGLTPEQALVGSLQQSAEAYVACFDGQVACLWGVQALDSSVIAGARGKGWLLTSDLVDRHPYAFMRLCRSELPGLLERWVELENYIDARYAKSLRWAARLGFVLDAPAAFGHSGLPFCRVHVRRGDLPWAQQLFQ